MHELSITRNIVALVSEAAAGRRVLRVTVAIGELSGVMAEAVEFCFEAVARGTPIEGAALEIQRVPGRARCRRCGEEFATPTLLAACPCGAREPTRIAGEELLVRTMELDDSP